MTQTPIDSLTSPQLPVPMPPPIPAERNTNASSPQPVQDRRALRSAKRRHGMQHGGSRMSLGDGDGSHFNVVFVDRFSMQYVMFNFPNKGWCSPVPRCPSKTRFFLNSLRVVWCIDWWVPALQNSSSKKNWQCSSSRRGSDNIPRRCLDPPGSHPKPSSQEVGQEP